MLIGFAGAGAGAGGGRMVGFVGGKEENVRFIVEVIAVAVAVAVVVEEG